MNSSLHPDALPERPYDVLRSTFGLKGSDSHWLRSYFRGREQRPFPHNGTLLEVLLDKVFSDPSYQWDTLANPDTVKKDITDIFKLAFRKDPNTGAYGKEAGKFFMDFVPEFKAANPSTPAALVEIDFSNMGNANLAIGRERVDRSIRIMKNIYQECLSRSPRDLYRRYKLNYHVDMGPLDRATGRSLDTDAGGVTAIRTGGDEMRFIVTGLDPSQIKVRLEWAQQAIAHFTTQLGTDTLEHAKYPGDSAKAGFGAGSGFVMLDGGEDSEKLQSAIDRKISDSKLHENFRRTKDTGAIAQALERKQNVAPETIVSDRRRQQWARVYDASKAKHYVTPKELRRVLRASHVKDILAAFEAQYDPSNLFKDSEWQEHYESLRVKPPQWPLPFTEADARADPYIARIADAEAYVARQGLTGKQQDLLLKAIALYNSHDPVTGFKSAHMVLEGIASAHTDTQGPVYLIEAEMTNLAGLNAYFNHEAADKIIRKAAGVFKQTLKHELGDTLQDYDFYSGGGSKFRLITHGIPPQKLHLALQKAALEIERDINQRSIHSLCDELHIAHTSFHPAPDEALDWNAPVSFLKHPKGHANGVMLGYAGVEIGPKQGVDVAPYYLQLVELLSEAFAKKPSITAEDLFNRDIHKQPNAWFAGNRQQPAFQLFGILPVHFHETAASNVRADRRVVERLLRQEKKADRIIAERGATDRSPAA